jgi:hypothetical protein
MRLKRLWDKVQTKVAGLTHYRRLKTRVFSGAPIIQEISRADNGGLGTWELRYRNGLQLTLGEGGIRDFQDRLFSQYLGNGTALSRVAMAQLHRLVLKSLLKYMVHPGLDMSQREKAAEVVSRLWVIWEGWTGPEPPPAPPLKMGVPP